MFSQFALGPDVVGSGVDTFFGLGEGGGGGEGQKLETLQQLFLARSARNVTI